jgi:hypothetical protein
MSGNPSQRYLKFGRCGSNALPKVGGAALSTLRPDSSGLRRTGRAAQIGKTIRWDAEIENLKLNDLHRDFATGRFH